ncbi:hypothetical protein KIN20_015214 [Parelaphostrongylus tenuis]|uniref:Uncharacterized protein n=1 Tax=Parelaphostrongylus tenuis TaxID=148309 RepID=A0AAD5QM37_PARTN|nr:hypothetical protein KIN20_015214 [Parelaphostrongylus tenuis]
MNDGTVISRIPTSHTSFGSRRRCRLDWVPHSFSRSTSFKVRYEREAPTERDSLNRSIRINCAVVTKGGVWPRCPSPE